MNNEEKDLLREELLNDKDVMESIRLGLEARRLNKMRPWREIYKELGIDTEG